MKKVSSAEMAKRFSMYCDLALNAPIVVTKNGRDRLVMLGVDEYNFLRDLVQKSGKPASKRRGQAAGSPRQEDRPFVDRPFFALRPGVEARLIARANGSFGAAATLKMRFGIFVLGADFVAHDERRLRQREDERQRQNAEDLEIHPVVVVRMRRRTSLSPASAKKNRPQRMVSLRQPASSMWIAMSKTIGSSSLPK